VRDLLDTFINRFFISLKIADIATASKHYVLSCGSITDAFVYISTQHDTITQSGHINLLFRCYADNRLHMYCAADSESKRRLLPVSGRTYDGRYKSTGQKLNLIVFHPTSSVINAMKLHKSKATICTCVKNTSVHDAV